MTDWREVFARSKPLTDSQAREMLPHALDALAAVRAEVGPLTPDVFTLGDDVGLVLTVEALARQAWADRLDPRVGMFVAEVTRYCATPCAKVKAIHDRLVPATGGAWPLPDADDYAIGLAAACLAAGLEVRLILAHQRGAPDRCCTVFVSVRVAFSLDADQDRAESWVVYGPEGKVEWPSPLIDSFAYVGVPGREP